MSDQSYDSQMSDEFIITTHLHQISEDEKELQQEGEFVKVHKYLDIVTNTVELKDIVATFFKDGKVNFTFQLVSKGRSNCCYVWRVTNPLHLQLIFLTEEGGTLHRWDIEHLRWHCSTNERKYYESTYPSEVFDYIAKSTIPGASFSTSSNCTR